MAFGLSAGAIAGIGAIAGPVIGGLMGGQESGQQQTQKQELDPRMQALLYGSEGNPGLLGDTDNLRRQQLAQGGLNNMQHQGLEMQRQTLMSPQYTQGFGQMQAMGSQLMNAGVAGNPFGNGGNGSIPMGRMGGMGHGAPMAAQGMPQQPMQPFQYDQQALQQSTNQPAAMPQTSPLDEYLRKLNSGGDKSLWDFGQSQSYGLDRGEAGGGR